MKRIISLIMVFSMVFCACGREEERKTVSNSGSGAAVGGTVTESAVSGGAAGEEEEAEAENGFELDPDMKLTMARNNKPMLSKKVDLTQQGIEMVCNSEFATGPIKGDDGNCYYFRKERKKGGKITFYRNNAIKVCETVWPEKYEKN